MARYIAVIEVTEDGEYQAYFPDAPGCIAAGDTDTQVINFLVARYGEFVLLKPRFERQTLLLWLLTPFALAGGGIGLWLQVRRRSRKGNDAPALTPEEKARVAALMSAEGNSGQPG